MYGSQNHKLNHDNEFFFTPRITTVAVWTVNTAPEIRWKLAKFGEIRHLLNTKGRLISFYLEIQTREMKQTCKYSTRKTLFLLKRKIFMSIDFWPKSWCQCVFHFMQHQTKRSLCCSQTTPQQKSNKRKCQYLLVFRLKRIKVELPCSYHISYSKSLSL